MKKKKGFVLVESIVAAVFVLGLSTFLIMNIIPLVGEYEKTLNYDSVDAKYDAHLIRKMILMDEACNVESILSFGPAFNNKPKYYYFEGDDICNFLSHKKYCRTLLSPDYLDVKEIIMTEYKGDALKKLSDIEYDRFSRQMQDYLKYMPTYDGTNSFYKYRNRIIVTFNDGSATNIEVLRPYSNESCPGAGGGGVPTPPYVTISASPTSWTNGNVTITGSGQGGSAQAEAYAFSENNPLPASDANWVHMSNTSELFTKTYQATKNGKYYFNLMDTEGSISSEKIEINYIDKKAPVCSLSGYTATCTDSSDASNAASYISGYAVGTSITTSSSTTSITPTATYTKTLGYNEKLFVVDRAGNKSNMVTAAGAPTHTVTYNCGISTLIGYGNGNSTNISYSEGSNVDLSVRCNNPSGRTFQGWKTTGNVLSHLTMGTSNITLTAVYKNTATPDTIPPQNVNFVDRCVQNGDNVREYTVITMSDNSGGSGIGSINIHYYWPNTYVTETCSGAEACQKETRPSITTSSSYSANNQFSSFQVDVCDVAGNCNSHWHNRTSRAHRVNNRWVCG